MTYKFIMNFLTNEEHKPIYLTNIEINQIKFEDCNCKPLKFTDKYNGEVLVEMCEKHRIELKKKQMKGIVTPQIKIKPKILWKPMQLSFIMGNKK